MRVACIQLRSGHNSSENVAHASELIRNAAGNGAQFVATPENTHIMETSTKRLFEVLQPEDQETAITVFGSLAQELGIHILIGSMAIKLSDRKAANRSFLFSPNGKVSARYDKIHMFDVQVSKEETWKESENYQAGQQAVMANIGTAKLGLSICYDLRFPHLYRRYAQAGADIITVPAAFTYPTGKAHWKTLLTARAIETGAYIMAPAQGGVHDSGRRTWGRSIIIDPWGTVLAELDHDDPGFICADINLVEVQDARRKIPAWSLNTEFTL